MAVENRVKKYFDYKKKKEKIIFIDVSSLKLQIITLNLLQYIYINSEQLKTNFSTTSL